MALNLDMVGFGPKDRTIDGVRIVSSPEVDEVNLYGSVDEEQPEATEPQGHNENLAARLSETERSRFAQTLIEYFDTDKESRQDWKRRLDKALEYMGVKEPPDNGIVENASKTTHPLIAKAVVQFNARAIEEIFPSTGPVKCVIAGIKTRDKEAQRDRVEDFMNYYLTKEDRGYYADTDQLLFRLPLEGSIFRRMYIDPVTRMPKSRYVSSEDLVAPYSGTCFEDMTRWAYRYKMSGSDIKRAVSNGEFIQATLSATNLSVVASDEDSLAKRADFSRAVYHTDDEEYELLEFTIDHRFEGIDDDVRPDVLLSYRITVERQNQEILSIRRNWRENDQDAKKRILWAHYKFFPGLGFYGMGFLHIIGSLQDATSDSVRALLDGAMAASFQGGFVTKDIKTAGSTRLTYGEWKQTEHTMEELQKGFYTPPFKEPSMALFNLLGALIKEGESFASITEMLTGEANNKAPVGTTIALIEQGMKVFSAVHKRIHDSQRTEFEALSELIYESITVDRYPYDIKEPRAGEPADLAETERFILKQDFDGRVDILPVADPNIYSATQRIALAQAVLELMSQFQQDFGPEQRREAYDFMFDALKVPEKERFLPNLQKPLYLDPVTENVWMATGKGVKAFEFQDHEAHIMVHQHYASTAMNTLPPEAQEMMLQTMAAHIREHHALLARQQIMQTLGVSLPPLEYEPDEEGLPPEVEAEVSRQMALAVSKIAVPPPANDQQQDPGVSEATKDEQARRDIERKDMAAVADNERKHMTWQAEEERKKAAFAQEQAQRQAEFDTQLAQEHASFVQGQNQETDAARAKMLRESAMHQASMANKTEEQKTNLAAKKEETNLKLSAQKKAAKAKPKAKK